MTADRTNMTLAEPTVAAGLARGLIEFAARKGADVEVLAQRSGIDRRTLDDHDLRVPMDRYIALMRAAKALTGDAALALHFGVDVDMAELSVVGLLVHASETFGEVLTQLNRYGRLIVEVDTSGADRFQLQRAAGKLWIVDTRSDPDDFPELTEATFGRFVGRTRQFGMTGVIAEVHVTHAAPPYAAEYERVLGAPTRFESGWNALRIDESWLSHRVQRQPRYVFGILGGHAERLLKDLEGSKTVRGRVEGLLMPILHTGDAGMARIAAALGWSGDTLYRKLKEEGVTFEEVLDALRHKLAIHYLSGRKVSVNEAAFLVGFSDPSAFSRAFKRWTGTSPRAMRWGE